MSAVQRFHEAANDALVKLSGYCPPGAKLALSLSPRASRSETLFLKIRAWIETRWSAHCVGAA